MSRRSQRPIRKRREKEVGEFRTGDDNRFVAYLDMLGMSNLAVRDPDHAVAVLLALDEIVSQNSNIAVCSATTRKTVSHPITWTFSDCIVIATEGATDADWWAIVTATASLFVMSLQRVIPLRGAIAYGRFIVTGKQGHIFGGPALVRAHDIAEDTGWLGVVVDETVASRYFDPEYLGVKVRKGGPPVLVRWSVSTKLAGLLEMPCLNWPILVADIQTKSPLDARDLYDSFSPMFGPFDTLTDRVKRMYQATADFINQANA